MTEPASEQDEQESPIPILWRVALLIILGFGLGWWLGKPIADLLWHTGWQLGLWLR